MGGSVHPAVNLNGAAFLNLPIATNPNILSNPIEYVKGVGPQRGDLLKKELAIFTWKDLLEHFPYRHIDKTKVNLIRDIDPTTEYIQIAARLISVAESPTVADATAAPPRHASRNRGDSLRDIDARKPLRAAMACPASRLACATLIRTSACRSGSAESSS